MQILVTGATGFLGSHLIPLLVAKGHRVRCIGRSEPTAPWPPSVEFIRGDLLDAEVVRKAIGGIDALIHLAGMVSFKNSDARKMYQLHVDATRELLKAVVLSGQKPRVVLASTSGTIAVSKTARVGTEADDYPIETVGRWPYYMSKIFEEKLALEMCQKQGLPLVVLNPSLLMGPGDHRLSSTWTVVKFLQRDLPVMPGGGISFVDARDVAQAAVNALTHGELYGRHLMGVNLTMKDFFHRLERLTGVAAPRLTLPKSVNLWGAAALERLAKWRGVDVSLDPQEVDIGEHWFWCDSSKAERELRFAARDPYETLHDTVHDILAKLPPGSLPGLKGRLAEARQ